MVRNKTAKKTVRKNARKRKATGVKRSKTFMIIQKITDKQYFVNLWQDKKYSDKEIMNTYKNLIKNGNKNYTRKGKYHFIYTIFKKYYIPFIANYQHKWNDYNYIWSIKDPEARGAVIGWHCIMRAMYFYFWDTLKNEKHSKGKVGQTNIRPFEFAFITHDKDKYRKTDTEVKDGKAKSGDLKDPHNHWALKFPKRVSTTQLGHWFGVPPNYVATKGGKNKYGWENLNAYLVHATNKAKYSYDPKDVHCDKGIFDYQKYYSEHSEKWDMGANIRFYNKRATKYHNLKNVITGEISDDKITFTDVFNPKYNRRMYKLYYMWFYNQISANQAFQAQQTRIGADERRELNAHKWLKVAVYVYGKSGSGKTHFNRALSRYIEKRMHWEPSYETATGDDPFSNYGNQHIVRYEDASNGSGLDGPTTRRMLDPTEICKLHSRYFDKDITARVFLYSNTNTIINFFKYMRHRGPDPVDQYLRRFRFLVHIATVVDNKGNFRHYAKVSKLVYISDGITCDIGTGYTDNQGNEITKKEDLNWLFYPSQSLGTVEHLNSSFVPLKDAIKEVGDYIIKANDPTVNHVANRYPKMTSDKYWQPTVNQQDIGDVDGGSKKSHKTVNVNDPNLPF